MSKINLTFTASFSLGQKVYYVKELVDGYWTIASSTIEALRIRVSKDNTIEYIPEIPGVKEGECFYLHIENVFRCNEDRIQKYIDLERVSLFYTCTTKTS